MVSTQDLQMLLKKRDERIRELEIENMELKSKLDKCQCNGSSNNFDTMAEMDLLKFPDDVLEIIFRQLSNHDIHQNLALVCKRFLRISRFPGMVKDFSLTIKNIAYDGPTDNGEMEAQVEKCLVKTKKAIELFPEAKLKLIYAEDFDRFDNWDYISCLRMESLVPFIPFMRKLTMETFEDDLFDEIMNERILDNTPTFGTLQYLEISVDAIHDAPEKFWNKFPNLISLKITFGYMAQPGKIDLNKRAVMDQPIFDFINTLAKNFPKLEKFYYEVFCDGYRHDWVNIESYLKSCQNEAKFLNLKELFVEMFSRFGSVGEETKNKAIKSMKNYFKTKCPKLGPIQTEMVDDYTIVFKSSEEDEPISEKPKIEEDKDA